MHLHRQFRGIVFLVFLFTGSFTTQIGADSAAAIGKLLSDASDIGPADGAAAPDFRLKDQNGRERDRGSLSGPNGLVLVFFRSADW